MRGYFHDDSDHSPQRRTSKQDLLNEIRAAYDAINEVSNVLGNVTVHGRDYYVQGPDAYTQARHEHSLRFDALRGVADELLVMYQGIEAQGRQS